MSIVKHKVFISYHHENDQWAKDELINLNKENSIFIDKSLPLDGLSETKKDGSKKTDDEIRIEIRDDYLRDTSVVLLLVGKETKNRKHIDWEIYSSMRDSPKNKKSSIVIIQLPDTNPTGVIAVHGEVEMEKLYSHLNYGWHPLEEVDGWERSFKYLPQRIIDNLVQSKISVTRWNDLLIYGTDTLCLDKIKFIIECAYNVKDECEYDLSQPMRRKNS